jgi:hypothetical protein
LLRRLGVVGVAAVVVLALALGGRLVWVHDDTWEWTLRPSATPPKVVVFDRDYRRSDGPPSELTGAHRPEGRTSGGGVILAPRPDPDVPTVIWVRGPDGLHTYALMGGP